MGMNYVTTHNYVAIEYCIFVFKYVKKAPEI